MFFTDRKKCFFSVNIFPNCFAFKENHVKIKSTRCIHTFFFGIIEIFNCLLRRVDSIPSCFFLLLKSNKSPFRIFSFMQGLFWLSKVRDPGSWPPSPPLKPPVGKTMKNLTNNWYNACKQQKRLFKMDIKTKLYFTKNIHGFNRNTWK